MFVYRPSLPIDYFDGQTPLNEWIAAGHGPRRTAWALRALFVLADSRQEIGWDGEIAMLAARHTSGQVAQLLGLAVPTVNNTLARAYANLGVAGRA